MTAHVATGETFLSLHAAPRSAGPESRYRQRSGSDGGTIRRWMTCLRRPVPMWFSPPPMPSRTPRCGNGRLHEPSAMRLGRRLRKDVPRSALGAWAPWPGRPDVVRQVTASHQGRVDCAGPGAREPDGGLAVRVPAGHRRGDGRGSRPPPATGIKPVICGDSHLGNFGFYASPERDLVIDLNDFDEAHPGSWEWDLRRLAASIWVAGRQNSATEDQCERAVAFCVATYREQVRVAGGAAAAGPRVRTAGRRPARTRAPRQSLRAEIRRAARRARDQHQRPGAAPSHRAARGRPPHRRGTPADHPRRRRGGARPSPRASTTT